jgi:prephenate dehydrogenase
MTAAFDEQEFGAGLDLFSKLKLLAEWAPLLNRLQMVALAKEPHDQALAVVSALQWAAGKSATEIDDQALAHVEAVLKTKEGQAMFNWVVGKIGGAV